MSEKKHLRLLPFRARRAEARRRATSPGRPPEAAPDAELSALLRSWEAPESSGAARARLLEAFRQQTARAPLWRRVLAARVSVPAPVAACAAVALLAAASALAFRAPAVVMLEPPRASASAPAVKIVEAPPTRERIVERVVYVEKWGRPASRGRRPEAASRPRPGGGPRRLRDQDVTGGGAETGYYTRVDMAEFQPAGEMKIRIINKGNGDDN